MRGGMIQHQLRPRGNLHLRLHVPVALLAILGFCSHILSASALSVSDAELQCQKALCTSAPRSDVKRRALEVQARVAGSFVAQYVLGSLEMGDANWPDAIRHLKAARVLVESAPGHESPDKPGELPWRPMILNALADALDAMDRNAEAEEIWQVLARLDPDNRMVDDFGSRRLRCLVKLGRLQDAHRMAGARLTQLGLTDIEKIQRRIDATTVQFAGDFDDSTACSAFKGIVRDATALPGAVVPRNDLAFHACRQGDYALARQMYKESAGLQNPASPSHPHWSLSDMDIAACNWNDASADIRTSWNWIQAKKASVRFELLADTRVRAAQYYLSVGYPERAEALALPYVTHPIRSGFSSRPVEQWEAGVNLLALSASRQVRSMENASTSVLPIHRRVWARLAHLPRLWREAVLARRIRTLIAGQTVRAIPLRDAFALVDAPPWLWDELVRVLGWRSFSSLFDRYPLTGVQHEMFTAAVQTDTDFAAHRWQDVVVHGRQALIALPRDEALLKSRITLLVAEALHRQGKEAEAREDYTTTYVANPAVFLLVGIPLPLSLTDAGSERLLRSSPLVRHTVGGLTVAFVDDAAGFNCVIGSADKRVSVRRALGLGADAPADRLAYRTLRSLLSPLALMSDAQFAALEGQAVVGPVEKQHQFGTPAQ